MLQTLASILFFVVFIEIFLTLSAFLGMTLYRYFKSRRKDEGQPTDQP